MLLHHTTAVESRSKGFLPWLLVLAVQSASGQYCQTDVASIAGTADGGGEYMFDCVEGAYVSNVKAAKDVGGFTWFELTCSDGEVSDIFGACLFCDSISHKLDCTGGWTQMSTTPNLNDDVYPAEASFFCYNEENPSGTSLGPYPTDGNPDNTAEVASSSCDAGSYAVGVSVFETFAVIFGVALHCRTIDEASCPAPDGLLVPTTEPTPEPTPEPTVEAPTPAPFTTVSPENPDPPATTPEPMVEPTPEPTPEATTPAPFSIVSPTAAPGEPTPEPGLEATPSPFTIETPSPTPIPGEPTPVPVFDATPDDDDDNDGGADVWTATATTVVSTVAAAVILGTLGFVFKRFHGGRGDGTGAAGGPGDTNVTVSGHGNVVGLRQG